MLGQINPTCCIFFCLWDLQALYLEKKLGLFFCVSPYLCIFSILKIVEDFQLPPKGPELNFVMYEARVAAFSVIYHQQIDMHLSEILTFINLSTRLTITTGSVRNHPKWKRSSLIHSVCLPFVAFIIHSMNNNIETMLSWKMQGKNMQYVKEDKFKYVILRSWNNRILKSTWKKIHYQKKIKLKYMVTEHFLLQFFESMFAW